ncbi:sigma-70 family RNA polymerase sigma factor [bacterium]|nr:MAG: sigma-70 family RNA polymerase sigma factor [bacterium]
MSEREAAIRALLPMVRGIARRIAYKVPTCELEDLIADGALGAIRAVDSFDPRRGVPLRVYARRLVFGSILNGVRRMDAIPEHVRREARVAERVRYELYSRLGRAPRSAEVAAACGLDERRVRSVLSGAALLAPLSLDEPLPAGMHEPVCDEDPPAILLRHQRLRAVRSALDTLPPREREVVRCHYFGRTTFDLVGRRLGVSRQRVSQLHVRALRRLRTRLARESAA